MTHWAYCRITDFSREDYRQAYRALSHSRKAHIDCFRREDDRMRSLAAGLLVQRLAREHFGIRDAVLDTGESGAPAIAGSDLFVSITHCDALVACALSTRPVGIDAERLKPRRLSLARRFCVEAELSYLLGSEDLPEGVCTDEALLSRFYEIWTAKEAWFKLRGTGITDLQAVNTLTLDRRSFRVEDFWIQLVFSGPQESIG